MSTKRACLACRARKVRCIPGPLRCERCTNLGLPECVFDSIKKRGAGRTLKMGEACNLCRIRKKKCDAKRPCTTCTQTKTAAECVYYDERDPYPSGSDPFYDAEGYFAGEGSPGFYAEASIDSHDTPDSVQLVTDEHGMSPVSVSRRSSGYSPGQHTISADGISPIFVLPSFLRPSIPPDLSIPLSLLGEENLKVRVSDIDATDTDMKSRLWLLVRLLKFGTHLSGKKMEALLQGDLSGSVLNRAFVCGGHVIGAMFTAGVDYSPAMVHFHARRVQAAWESLADLFKSDDHETCLHAAILVVSSHVYMRMPQMALLYIQKSYEFIKKGDLKFVPTCGRPPRFSEDLHEILAALSQTIYWANYLFLMCGGPKPDAIKDLEKQFQQDLPQFYPILFRICPLTMRTQGILLVKDAVLYHNLLPTDSVKFGFWRKSCDQMLEMLEGFCQKLIDNVKTFRKHGDNNGADSVSSSCIACLAHLATLYQDIGRADPSTKAEMDNRCDSALQRLGTLSSELQFDEYTYLDLLLGDSWNRSLSIFSVRIDSLPPEESELLCHFLKIVGEMYFDFSTRLSGCEPPTLYSLATMEDGRTRESRYPSLMSFETRVMFGI